jgi:hypothetical protein
MVANGRQAKARRSADHDHRTVSELHCASLPVRAAQPSARQMSQPRSVRMRPVQPPSTAVRLGEFGGPLQITLPLVGLPPAPRTLERRDGLRPSRDRPLPPIRPPLGQDLTHCWIPGGNRPPILGINPPARRRGGA